MYAIRSYYGRINIKFFLLYTLFVLAFSVLYSSFAVFYEKYVYNRYKGVGFMVKVFFLSVIEIVAYHPLNLFFALAGNFDFFIRKRHKGWGTMEHKGFDS